MNTIQKTESYIINFNLKIWQCKKEGGNSPLIQVWAHKVRGERESLDENYKNLHINLYRMSWSSGHCHLLWLLFYRLGGIGFHPRDLLWANHFTRRGWTFSTTNFHSLGDHNYLLHQLGKRQLWLLCVFEKELNFTQCFELTYAPARPVGLEQKSSLRLGRMRVHKMWTQTCLCGASSPCSPQRLWKRKPV